MYPKDYPKDWFTRVRPTILRRAGGQTKKPVIGARCEWCGIRNYTVKMPDGTRIKHDSYKDALATKRAQQNIGSIVVLTIAHIEDKDPMNTDPNNLAALCQACHLKHDIEDTRRAPRRFKYQREAPK